jgi:hypothetical protein
MQSALLLERRGRIEDIEDCQQKLAIGGVTAKPRSSQVSRLVAHYTVYPTPCRTEPRVEAARLFPDLKERVLDHILGEIPAPDDTLGYCKQPRRFPLVDVPQPSLVSGCACQQRGFQVTPHGANLLGQVAS